MQDGKGHRGARRALASQWLLALAVAGAALAVGTVHTITLCVVTNVLAIAAALGWWNAEPMRARTSATLVVLTALGLTGYTLLQCVPMPMAWLAVIAPHNADVWSRALSPMREAAPRWAPISLDPIATRVEVLKGVAYLLAFVTALRVARRKEGVAFLSAVIMVTAVVLAVAAVLHPAFGTRRLFGVFDPGPGIADRHIAPLMNANNLAGYLNIGICLALAAVLSPVPRIPRFIAAAVTLVLTATQIWVASRGGVVAMVLSMLVLTALTRVVRFERGRQGAILSLVSGVAVLAGIGMIALSSEGVQGELMDADISKLEVVRQALRMIPSFALFGAGRGSFESTFPAFRVPSSNVISSSWHVTFTHPENVVAQWSIEWGLPISLIGFAAIAWALRPTAILARSTSAAGAWVALLAVAVQNFGDLSSEVPGVVLTLVVSAALVTGGSAGRRSDWRVERWSGRPKVIVIGGLSTALVSIVVCAWGDGHQLSADDKRLYRAAIAQPRPLAELETMARGAMLRHPSEPYIPFIVGMRAVQDRAPQAIAWLGATLDRAAIYGPAHFGLARAVAQRSRSQGRLEYRLAMEQAPELIGYVMAEAPRYVDGYWDALELTPTDKRLAALVLDKLASSIAERLPATRARIDAEVAARDSAAVGPAARLAADAVEDIEGGQTAPWCERDARSQCLQDALKLSTRLRALEPAKCSAYVLRARALVAAGDERRGLDELERAADTVDDRVPCLLQLAQIANRSGESRVVDEALDKVVHAGCNDSSECVQRLAAAASIEEARGSLRRALATYRRAYEQAPNDDDLLEQIARVASLLDLHAEAHQDYETLARRHPDDRRWADAAEREKQAAMRELL